MLLYGSQHDEPRRMSRPITLGGAPGAGAAVSPRNAMRQETRILRRRSRQQQRNGILERGLYWSALPILIMLVMIQRSWNERSSIEAYLALMPTSPPPILEGEHPNDGGSHAKKVEPKHKTLDKKTVPTTKRKVETAHKESKAKIIPKPTEKREMRGKIDTDKAKLNTTDKPKDKASDARIRKTDAAQKKDSKQHSTDREGLAEKLLADIDRQFSLSIRNATSKDEVPNCLDPNGPQPVILMSLGRSGSSSTWQVLGSLTGQETKSVEYTGSSREESIRFFEKIGPNDNGLWVLKYMCFMQRVFPNAGVVGFKWKPNRSILSMAASVNGLKLLGKLQSPSIKVVRSRRNLLDVLISRYKHKRSTSNVPAHCKVGDKKCLEKQLKAGIGVELPAYKVMSLLKTLTREENDVDKRLKAYGVPRISASFEKLYYSDDASEWKKVLQFLSPKSAKRIGSISDVRRAMTHQATSHPSHKKTIRNFDEVRAILNGTKFEKLLRP